MDWIYPVSYLTSLTGLVMWFVTQDNKQISRKMSALFLLAFFVYLGALSFSSGTTAYKLLILVRDMVVMGIVSQLFNVFRKNVLLAVGLGAVAVLTVYLSYFRTLDLSFPQFPAESVDPSAEFLIQVDADNLDVLEDMRADFNCTIERAFHPQKTEETPLDDYYVVDLRSSGKRKMRLFYDRYMSSRRITWIEPNEEMQLDLPDAHEASRSSRSHFLNDPGIDFQWAFEPLEIDELHRALTGSQIKPLQTASVVILDTGVDAAHEDLTLNYKSIQSAGDTDPNGHGTHCAGVAGAVSNNAVGIASLGPSSGFVRVSGIRVLNAMGMGTQKAIVDGLITAADNGADVISISLGGVSNQSKQKVYRDAVRYADNAGAIVVVAAGNNNRNARTVSPANVEGVIVVTAIDRQNQKAVFSNTVEDIGMGIAAPGVDIYSTLPGNRYGAHSGTSMATPQVSGLIGLIRSLNPKLTSKEVYDILKSTGIETNSGKLTGPLIQPLKAVEKVID